MTTGNRMKNRRKELGIPVDTVAAALGVSVATVYRYENGEIEKVPGAVLEPLARVLQTTPAYLMGWEDSPAPIFSGLPSNVTPLEPMQKIPLVGQIACGVPILAEENITDYVDLPAHIRADFALTCKGDSMVGAGIRDGDVVYIRQQEEVENGQIAAVMVGDEEATLKRFYMDSGVVQLVSENPSVPPKVFIGNGVSQIRVIGLAVAYTHVIHQ